MRKHLLVILAMAVLATACGRARNVASAADCARPLDVIERELVAAQAEVTKQARKPAEKQRSRVAALEEEKKLMPCAGSPDTTVASPPTTVPGPSAQDVANQINEILKGFGPGQVLTGDAALAAAQGAPEERGTAAFSQRTLKSPEEVGQFLREDTELSRAALVRVTTAIREAGYGDEEVVRALDGSGYFPVTVTVAARVLGTTYFRDGQVREAGHWRSVQANDMFFLFLSRDGKIIVGATVRADCANPGLVSITPIPPGEIPPPVDVPPGEKCPYNPGLDVDDPRCFKQPGQNIDRNPTLEPGVGGPGPPRPPGPATVPVDSPTGCVGRCPGAVTPTTPTTTGSGPEPVVPGCGVPGKPPCNNTGVTNPTPATTPPSIPQSQPPAVGGEGSEDEGGYGVP